MTRRKTGQRAERGIALAIALFAMTTLLLAATAATLIGSADIRATRNYRGASQVHYVAESGIAHAMQVVDAPGVVNFQLDVAGQWVVIFGNGAKPFAPLPGFTYTVLALPNFVDPANLGILRAVANGPEGVSSTVVAHVRRSNIPSVSPGAVYLSQDNATDSSFTGNAFAIDGNDHNYTGGAGPSPPIPGISTRNATNTTEAIASLSGNQKADVKGLGYLAGPPVVPSITTTGWAPSVAQVNQIAADLLARPGVVTYVGGKINGNSTFGTTLLPQITYFSGDTTVGNGNASGAGIMIVAGDLTIQGNLSFEGLILVQGKTHVTGNTDVTGNATVYGSLWTNDVDFQIGGSAVLNYSSQALALANLVSGGAALPSPIQLVWLVDCAQVPPATGGCP